MTICALCSKTMSSGEMSARSNSGVMDILGIGGSDNDPFSNMMRSMTGAMSLGRKCDKCGEWLCNSCATKTASSSGASQIRHSDCGGIFQVPR